MEDSNLPFASPSTVLLLRTPVPPDQGTDPYHDAFGSFCLPSFPLSALDSGAATPIAPRPRGNSAHRSDANTLGMTPAATDSIEPSNGKARPEELLLQALQKQQQPQPPPPNLRASGRASSPQRNYTRQQPSYGSDASSVTVPSASSQGSSLVLTTHHIGWQELSFVQASKMGLSEGSVDREWCVTSLPVLGSESVNGEQVEEWLEEGDWGAVVATSNRAWDVWRERAIRCGRKGKGE